MSSAPDPRTAEIADLPEPRATDPLAIELTASDPTNPINPGDFDPVCTDPERYRILLGNARVRVLEYLDRPGDSTHLHTHPDSVMVPLAEFRRGLRSGDRLVDVELHAGEARWLDAQAHAGTNIGDTPSHAIFIELKEPRPGGMPTNGETLGPQPPR